MTRLITLLFFVLALPEIIAAQDEQKVVLPDPVMQQVVSRILRWQFKSPSKPKTIPLAASQVKPEWLPQIRNVSFDLVTDNKALQFEKGIFLVEGLAKNGSNYSINVGWGDLECDAYGDTWYFKTAIDGVRLWKTNGRGWGRVCGSSDGVPHIRGLSIGDVSPNELPGYRFFNEGRLRTIRIGQSQPSDVQKIFGSTCEADCDYDEHWTLRVAYFTASGGTESTITNGVENKYLRRVNPEFVGRVESVTLTPKDKISFDTVKFSRSFGYGTTYSIGDTFDSTGFRGAVHSEIVRREDGYGLDYQIYGRETFNNLDDPSRYRPPAKGQLLSIEYHLPQVVETQIYTLVK